MGPKKRGKNCIPPQMTLTYRFEKKFVKRDVDCWCSGWFFCPKIGVDGAEPRRHAFSYDVSRGEMKRDKKKPDNFN